MCDHDTWNIETDDAAIPLRLSGLTFTAATLKLYVNGAVANSQAVGGAIQSTSSPLWIGGNQPYGEYFLGVIADAQIYNRALTATEISTVVTTPLS